MDYKIKQNTIEIYDKQNFNMVHILECGQVFTYEKVEEGYVVLSKDKKALIFEKPNMYVIETNDTAYFENYFDLKTDYKKIKEQILDINKNFEDMLEFGHGIRILRQDYLEIIIGFIISANNNIKRITNSMKYIRQNAGSNMGSYYAFPTVEQLLEKDEEFFRAAGLGYRAPQIVKAIKQLKEINLQALDKLNTKELREELLKLYGVGGKVADCVLLFAYYRQDVFPVDTWIEKIYHEQFDKKEKSREVMRQKLVKKFKNLAGYAQQYMFYYKRSKI